MRRAQESLQPFLHRTGPDACPTRDIRDSIGAIPTEGVSVPAIIITVAVLAIVALWATAQYNGLVRLRNLVQESWKQIDVELQRRHDLIPNLVETVKGYAKHERETFEAVTQARAAAAAPGSTVAQQAAQENVLTQALGRLFAVAEAYPELKANIGFQQLQQELTNTEDVSPQAGASTTPTCVSSTPRSRSSRPTSSPGCSTSRRPNTSRWTTRRCGPRQR